MKLTIPVEDGPAIEFECEDTFASNWVCGDILRGKTYPHLPFVDDVRVIFDVGANCGATSVHLARHYPDARIHAFEPGTTPWGYLERNVASLPNIEAHRVGLFSTDDVVPLYRGDGDAGMASVFRRSVNLDESEPVQLRHGGAWAAEHGIDRIDVLKVDVEGCEVPVVQSLTDLLSTVKILYLEYDSRQARRDLAGMLDATHELYIGKMFLDQGECVYLRKDYAELDAATDCLRGAFRGAMQAGS